MQVIYTVADFTFASQELMLKYGSNREKKFVEYYRACDPLNQQYELNTHSDLIEKYLPGGIFDDTLSKKKFSFRIIKK